MKKLFKHSKIFCLAAVVILLFTSMPVSAATPLKNKWLVKNQRVYYYNAKGKKSTGITTIKNKKYYFNSEGIQYTGWQMYKGNYYFFNIANGTKGSMVTSKTVDGVTLTSTGKAKLTSYSRRKLKIMYRANQVMETVTNKKSKMSKRDKLWACFNYAKGRRLSGSKYLDPSSNWDMTMAEYMFFYNSSDCTCLAAGFAYLANAVGYTNVAVIASDSGYSGHSWAEVNGLVYDPDWSLMDGSHNYFGMSYGTSGGSVPAYASNRAYIKKL